MSSPTQKLIAELNHEINSPLAAIRNAIYLISRRSDDTEVHRYLEIADQEVVRIAAILRVSREACGSCPLNQRSRSKAA